MAQLHNEVVCDIKVCVSSAVVSARGVDGCLFLLAENFEEQLLAKLLFQAMPAERLRAFWCDDHVVYHEMVFALHGEEHAGEERG